MTPGEFEDGLRRDGYLDIRHRLLERGQDTQPHAHDFDTRLLILEGEMTVSRGDSRHVYRAGDILDIPAGEMHRESYAAAHLRFIAGLRRRADATAGS